MLLLLLWVDALAGTPPMGPVPPPRAEEPQASTASTEVPHVAEDASRALTAAICGPAPEPVGRPVSPAVVATFDALAHVVCAGVYLSGSHCNPEASARPPDPTHRPPCGLVDTGPPPPTTELPTEP